MKVDANEILFIKNNAPHGMLKMLAVNINMDHQKVRSWFNNLREEYPDDFVIEARRLLKETTGIEFKSNDINQLT